MRKEKQYHYIYKTTNILNNKYYYGMHSTNNLNDGYMGSGLYIRRSINKHGKENHKIEFLEFFNTRDELKSREREIVNLQEIAKKDCMNLRIGGTGGNFTKEQQLLGSKNGVIKANELRVTNPEWWKLSCEKRGKGNKLAFKEGRRFVHPNFSFEGKTHSIHVKQKMSDSKKGKGKGNENSQFGTCWITNEIENKKIPKGSDLPYGFRFGRIIGST